MYKEIERYLPQVLKPGRYIGSETGSIIKDKSAVKLRFCFCFPDIYEIGMSYLGQKILYGLLNADPEVWCERTYAPWPDMEAVMREHGIGLYGLESGDDLRDFDLVGFTLQYELSYSNILNMLDLGGIPLRSADRKTAFPLVVAGGPCVCNMEPLCDFIDLAMFGDGEEVLPELTALCKRAKAENWAKQRLLEAAAQIEGVYVPALYQVSYLPDGRIESVTPTHGAPAKVRRRIVTDFEHTFIPEPGPIPYLEIIQSRAATELFRGCIRGCRFCQAGYLYRPVRERSVDTVCKILEHECEVAGYEEMALSSLSTSDYTGIVELLQRLTEWTAPRHISLSLPSLRVDNFSSEVLRKVSAVRKSGLTFAPEAGSQRLRDVINKNVTEAEFERTCDLVFSGGYTTMKLYFMIGLPTETAEDITAIAGMAQKAVDLYYRNPEHPHGRAVTVNVGVSTFVPKPFTPFQWVGQNTPEQIVEKQRLLLGAVDNRKVHVSYHDMPISRLEGVFARGDRRLGTVLEAAQRKGCRLDGWNEHFKPEVWQEAFDEAGIDMDFYATRQREEDEVLPWDHMDAGVTKAHLLREYHKAQQAETSPNCRRQCTGCGMGRYGVCGQGHDDGGKTE